MLKIMAIAAVVVFPFVLGAAEANAQGKQLSTRNLVRCPAGTCSKLGTEQAKDIRACSAANCRKSGPK
jgi:hypothetical protein